MMNCDPQILEAVKDGEGSNLGDVNPYIDLDQSVQDNLRKVAGWDAGYKLARQQENDMARWSRLSLFRKMLCTLDLHKEVFVGNMSGRPHLDRSGTIVGRDAPRKIYDCAYCGFRRTYVNKAANRKDEERRRIKFRNQMRELTGNNNWGKRGAK